MRQIGRRQYKLTQIRQKQARIKSFAKAMKIKARDDRSKN